VAVSACGGGRSQPPAAPAADTDDSIQREIESLEHDQRDLDTLVDQTDTPAPAGR